MIPLEVSNSEIIEARPHDGAQETHTSNHQDPMSNDSIISAKVLALKQGIDKALALRNQAVSVAGEATEAAWRSGQLMLELETTVGEKQFKKFHEQHFPNLSYDKAKVWKKCAKECTLEQIKEDNNRRQLMLSMDILPHKQHNTSDDRPIPQRITAITLRNKFEVWFTQFQRDNCEFSELNTVEKEILRRDLWPIRDFINELYEQPPPPSVV